MARKKYEFRPDPTNTDNLGKLLLTKKQSLCLLKWVLLSLVCVLALLVQDVIMSRVSLYGATTDLVPCVILMICIMQGAESGSVFALAASCVYAFSGSAPGPYVIALLTVIAVLAVIFRQAYLRKGFSTLLLCAGAGLMVYEMALFGIGLFLERTVPGRFGAFSVTCLMSMVFMPVLYPILVSIGKIGGETWKE